MQSIIKHEFSEHIKASQNTLDSIADQIETAANKIDCKSIGLSGKDGREFNPLCDVNILVNSNDTPRIQEMHILIGHIICHLIEQESFKSK
jgi:D-sedoheptulose 7-phosphate isomerase